MVIVLYELKRRKWSWTFLGGELMFFLSAFIIRKYFSGIIIKFVQLINRYSALRAFFGFKQGLEMVNSKDIMLAFFAVYIIFFCYYVFSSMADTILYDKTMGNIQYFRIHSVSGNTILGVKLVINLLIDILLLLVIWIPLKRFSLMGVSEVEFFVTTISEDVARIMKEALGALLLMSSLGFLYGCISVENNSRRFSFNFFAFLGILALLPNLIRVIYTLVDGKGGDTRLLTKIYHLIYSCMKCNPLRWANPTFVLDNSFSMLWYGILAGSIAVVMGVLMYRRRY